MKLQCPYCKLVFRLLAANGDIYKDTIAPIVCEKCGIISLLDHGEVKKLTQPELDALKTSPSWEVVLKYQEIIKNAPTK